MLLNKKTLLSLFLIAALLVLALFLYFSKNNDSFLNNFLTSEIDGLRDQNPELALYIDDIEKFSKKLNDQEIATYADLGLAFKSLADQTGDKKHYQKALDVYEKAIELTKRKNIVFILNAGNMAVYTGDYQTAKSYYEEAISVAPGDIAGYQKLIELHMYQLKSPKEDIIAVFDKGIKRMFDPDALKKWKASYLKSLNENK